MKQSKIVMAANMMLLPPGKDVCQECATKHEPAEPHNQASLYYQIVFFNNYNRYPTWEDAMSHCTKETKDAWEKELRRAGEWK